MTKVKTNELRKVGVFAYVGYNIIMLVDNGLV